MRENARGIICTTLNPQARSPSMSAFPLHEVEGPSPTPNSAKQKHSEARAKQLPTKSAPVKESKGAGGKAKKGDKGPKTKKREAVAADLMQREALCCGVNDSLHAAARLMWEHDVGAIAVVNDAGEPVSMITDRDTCMAAYTQGVALHSGTVSSAMSKRLVTCDETTPVAQLRELMASAQVRRLPVVDARGKLVGIVGLSDIFAEAHAPLPKDRKRGSSGPLLLQLVDALLQKPQAD